MEAAFGRLTAIQQRNVNKRMFAVAYNCVIRSGGDPDVLLSIIVDETSYCRHLLLDLLRYCKLVRAVM